MLQRNLSSRVQDRERERERESDFLQPLAESVGLPIRHAVMWLCRYAVARVCGYAGIISRYVARRYGVIGHVVLWCAATRHLAVGCCFHILCH